jgi:hypothetical protein
LFGGLNITDDNYYSSFDRYDSEYPNSFQKLEGVLVNENDPYYQIESSYYEQLEGESLLKGVFYSLFFTNGSDANINLNISCSDDSQSSFLINGTAPGNDSTISINNGLIQLTTNADSGTTGEYLGSDGSGNVVWGTPSDIKLKENIVTISESLQKINQLNPVTFDFKESGEHSRGFIAQEVEQVFPEMVTDKNGTKHLKNYFLEPYLVKAIQELTSKVNELTAEVELLKSKL